MDNRDAQIARVKAEAARRAAEEAARRAKEQGKTINIAAQPPVTYNVKKTKNVTIKNMTQTASWRLESAEDVESVLDVLRQSLLAELEEYDIVNVEF
jgi:Tfp pilus assembly protein PilX